MLGALPPARDDTGGGGVPGTGGAGGIGGGATATSASSSSSSSSASSASSSSTSGTGGSCCDCDADGHLATACGGDDCDDDNADVHFGQMDFFATPDPDPAVGFDYDCSGAPDRNPQLITTVNCGLIGLPCSAATGWLASAPPACGESAQWGTCQQQGLTCVTAVIETSKVMTCH